MKNLSKPSPKAPQCQSLQGPPKCHHSSKDCPALPESDVGNSPVKQLCEQWTGHRGRTKGSAKRSLIYMADS